MQKSVWIRNQRFIPENIMFSSFKYMGLTLEHIWRPYKLKTRNNTSRQWMTKYRVLCEGTHGRLFQGSQLLITM